MMTDTAMASTPAETLNRRARTTALAAYAAPQPTVEWVEYKSRGRLLIIGAADDAWPVATALAAKLDCSVLATQRPATPPESAPPVPTTYGKVHALDGWLGAFTLEVETGQGGIADGKSVFGPHFDQHDLVLDLESAPAIARDVPPLGYYHAPDAARRKQALGALPDMVGEFEKPRFIDYDPDICAHGNRGLAGCRACIDACPAEAPFSLGERIGVNYNLCQGCGSCTVACPTGAITYATPPVADLLGSLRRLLTAYRNAGGTTPVIVFHGENEPVAPEQLPGHVTPIQVEDVGSLGLEAWLALLAFGACQLRLLANSQTPRTLIGITRGQIELAALVLAGLGDEHAARRVQWVGTVADACAADAPAGFVREPATFAALGNKREVFRMALAHLRQHARAAEERIALPSGAPFGAIDVNHDACTLCMACVSVCPASAVQGGGDKPQLWFREDHCVQCGLCEKACPEDAITLTPQLDVAAHLEPERRLLHEEIMQVCLGCGKPFTTHKMVVRMQARLQDHWMFKSPEARKILLMCDECRIRKVFGADAPIHPHPQ